MNSYRTSNFRKQYDALPPDIGRAADKAYSLWKADTAHPGLRFKPVEGIPGVWSARITQDYRAVCTKEADGWCWFGIGNHDYFDKLS